MVKVARRRYDSEEEVFYAIEKVERKLKITEENLSNVCEYAKFYERNVDDMITEYKIKINMYRQQIEYLYDQLNVL